MSETINNPQFKFKCYPSIEHGKANGRDWTHGNNWKFFIQEKIDGSQFSFSVADGKLHFYCGHSEKSVEKQAALQYSRLPKMYCMIYDIQTTSDGEWLMPAQLQQEAERLGMECVPTLFDNSQECDVELAKQRNPVQVAQQLIQDIVEGKLQSALGGSAEGVVVKCHNFEKVYSRPIPQHITDPETLAKIEANKHSSKFNNTKLKFVVPSFKERNTSTKLKGDKLLPSQFINWLGAQFCTEARYNKGRQRLRDRQDMKVDDPNYKRALEEDLDRDLIKEYEDLIRKYLQVEMAQWLKAVKNASAKPLDSKVAADSVIQKLQQIETIDHVYDLLIQDVCVAARATLLF
jgi:hypothetical protein